MTRSVRPFAVFAAAALLLVPGACAPDGAPPRGGGAEGAGTPDLAIVGVTVVDAVEGVREGRTVVVDDGRIVSVEPTAVGEAGAVDAATVVDGTGRWLIPGLWDFHVHLTYDDRFTEAMPGMFLRWGVTSIRDTGGALDAVLPVVERLEAEGAVAPRVWFAGPLLDGEAVVYDGVARPALGIANPDVETARANVARLAEAGVDFIKVYEMITPEVFAALVEESDARRLPRDGHVPLSMLAREVGPRMQSLEHLRNIEMDCAADAGARLEARRAALAAWNPDSGQDGGDLRSRLHSEHRIPSVERFDPERCRETLDALSGTIQVPTLRLNALGLAPPWMRGDWEAALDRTPTEAAADWRAAGERQRNAPAARDTTYGTFSLHLVQLMHEAGVPVAAGTDTPIGFALPGYSLHSELEMLVRAGLPEMEALRAATIRPAEFIGLEGEMGTVAPGRLADLVLLSANPLDDIANTRTVEAVVSKGELLTLAELERLVGVGVAGER